jgi:thymidylate synthase
VLIRKSTVDDLLRSVFKHLFESGTHVKPTRGVATELTGVLLELTNPRARISRTEVRGRLFSCLGELLWYLAGTNELPFIAHYLSHYREESEDGKTVYGAYGPRLFNLRGNNQVTHVLNLLRRNPYSRRGVIQLVDAEDISKRRREIPCTCLMQFMVRDNHLHMITTMRSNDAFLGLSHDLFAFTMVQEIFAKIPQH